MEARLGKAHREVKVPVGNSCATSQFESFALLGRLMLVSWRRKEKSLNKKPATLS